MGRNKNKGFDLAKRQEKILKRMSKPLYKKSDNSTYFVITQPFGMHPNPAARGPVDTNRLSSWISWVFRQESVVEAVYTMSTKDEVIVRIAEGVDAARMLGEHKYNNILNAGGPWDPSTASCVFAYNYEGNGDPSGHNWREHIPSDVDVPPNHFRSLYPVPTWAARPSYLSGLAFVLPDSLPRTPKHSPPPPLEVTQIEDVKQQEPSLPPYNANTATSKHPSVSGSVKVEPSIIPSEPAYEPAQALRDQIALLNASRSQASVRVKQEPVTQIQHEPSDPDPMRFRSETYDTPGTDIDAPALSVKKETHDVQSPAGPSQALLDEWSRYQSMMQQTPSRPAALVKQEPYNPQPTAQIPTAQSPGTAGPLPTFEEIKRECVADEDVLPRKRPKTEIN